MGKMWKNGAHGGRLLFKENTSRKREKKRRAPVDRGLREGGKTRNSPLRINSIPNNARCRKLPIVGIFFKGYYVEALVDSGSEATLMSDRLWMREREKKLEGSPSLVGVDGSELEVVGRCEEEIQLGKTQVIRHQYYVVKSMPYDIILGTDFLEKNKAIVDLGQREVTINGEIIEYSRGQYVMLITVKEGQSPQRGDVRLACNTTIPPHSRKKVFARTDEIFEEGRETVIENLDQEEGECYVEPALLNKRINRQKFPVIMVNDSDQPRKLVANIRIGKLGAMEKIHSRSMGETCAMIANLRVKENSKGNQEQATAEMRCNLEEITDPRQKEKVSELVNEFEMIFSKGDNDLGRTSLVSHEINTQGADPVYQRAYRVPLRPDSWT